MLSTHCLDRRNSVISSGLVSHSKPASSLLVLSHLKEVEFFAQKSGSSFVTGVEIEIKLYGFLCSYVSHQITSCLVLFLAFYLCALSFYSIDVIILVFSLE